MIRISWAQTPLSPRFSMSNLSNCIKNVIVHCIKNVDLDVSTDPILKRFVHYPRLSEKKLTHEVFKCDDLVFIGFCEKCTFTYLAVSDRVLMDLVFNIPIIIDMKLIKHYQVKVGKLKSVTSILHLNLRDFLGNDLATTTKFAFSFNSPVSSTTNLVAMPHCT